MSHEISQLTPASVWVRKDGSLNTVLFISNETLSELAQLKFPPQVIYADGDSNIFTRSVGDFLKDRQFYNVNGELESRLDALFQLDEDSLDEEDLLLADEDEDELQVEDPKGLTTDEEEDEEPPEWDESELVGLDTVSSPSTPYVPPVTYTTGVDQDLFDLDTLSLLTESYVQDPVISDSTLYHRLFIQAAAGLTKDILHSLFTVTKGITLVPTVTASAYFDAPMEIDWTKFLGIYVQVHETTTYFIVVLGTPLVTEEVDDSVISPPTSSAALHAALVLDPTRYVTSASPDLLAEENISTLPMQASASAYAALVKDSSGRVDGNPLVTIGANSGGGISHIAEVIANTTAEKDTTSL